MFRYNIPKRNVDLKKYAIWKNLKYLLGYIGYCALFFLAFAGFMSRRYKGAEPLEWWVYLLFAVVVLVSGWLVCCMYRFVGDRSFSGILKRSDLTRSYDRGLSRKAGFHLEDHTYVKMRLQNEEGKKRKIKVQLFDDGYDGYYKENEEIVKFRGLNYPICIESEREGNHICAVCGVRTYYVEGKMPDGSLLPEIRDGIMICRSCGHTMINVDELEGEKR